MNQVRFPAGPGVRLDTHLYAGYEIPQYYDSMVAKLIIWGPTREIAIARMRRALAEFEIDGVPTTAKFHEAVLQHPLFLEGSFNTGFVEQQAEYFKKYFGSIPEENRDQAALLSAVLAAQDQQRGAVAAAKDGLAGQQSPRSLWHERARNEATRRGGI